MGGGIFSASKYGTTILNSTISGNTAQRGGGIEVFGVASYPQHVAKYNPTLIKNTTISGNGAVLGSGVEVGAAATGSPVRFLDSTISGNHGQANSFGGGLLVSKYVYSSVDVSNSTISGNTATHGGGVSLSYGGSTDPLLDARACRERLDRLPQLDDRRQRRRRQRRWGRHLSRPIQAGELDFVS